MKSRAFDNSALVRADEMSHILGAPIERLEEMACGGSTLSVAVGWSHRYCVEEVIQFVLESDLPFPPETGNGSPEEAWEWAADAYYGIEDQPTAPSCLAWRIWLWARWSSEGETRLTRYYYRCAMREVVGALRRRPSLRSGRAAWSR